MRIERAGWFLMAAAGCSPTSAPVPAAQPEVLPASVSAPAETEGVQALYGSDGRPLTDAPVTVMPLREDVTRVPTQRERGFVGLGMAHPPRVGRRDVEIRGARLDNALRMLAEHGRFNLVLPSTLAEPVHLRLRGVEPYDALRAVARSHGLEVVYVGEVVTVAPADEP